MSIKTLAAQARGLGGSNMIFSCFVGASLLLPLAGSASLVQDGSFEQRTALRPFETISAGTTMGGWNVIAGSVDLINGYWQAADGNQSLDLSGVTHGTIQQSVTAVAGNYRLSFDLSGNSDGPPAIKTVRVSLGNISRDFSFSTSGSNGYMNWALQSWDVTLPAGGSTLLTFQDISGGIGFNPPYYGAALDNISLVAIPEPATMIAGALLLLPFGARSLRLIRKHRVA